MNRSKQRMEVFKNLAKYSEEMFSNNLKSNKAITNFKINPDSKSTLSSKTSNTIDLKKFYNQLQKPSPLYNNSTSNINEILKNLDYDESLKSKNIRNINPVSSHLIADYKKTIEENKSTFNFDKEYYKFLDWLNTLKCDTQVLDIITMYANQKDTFIQNVNSPYAFRSKGENIEYNPYHKNFNMYNIKEALLHELSHKVDKFYFKASENEEFKKSFEMAKRAVSNNKELYKKLEYYVSENGPYAEDMSVNDIVCTLSDTKIEVDMGHDKDYLDTYGIFEMFSGISILSILNNKAINDIFVNTELLQLYKTYQSIV